MCAEQNICNVQLMYLDLNFQCWRTRIENLGNIQGYSIDFLYSKYIDGWTSEEFYNYFVYLPF